MGINPLCSIFLSGSIIPYLNLGYFEMATINISLVETGAMTPLMNVLVAEHQKQLSSPVKD